MKLNIHVIRNETIEIKFVEHARIPGWIFGGYLCSKCQWEIEDNKCIVALSEEGKQYVFHINCYEG